MLQDAVIRPKMINDNPVLIAIFEKNVFFDLNSLKTIVGMNNVIYPKDERTLKKVISFLNVSSDDSVIQFGAGKSKMKFIRFDVASMMIMSFKPSFDNKLKSISLMKTIVDEHCKECPLFGNHDSKEFGKRGKYKTSSKAKRKAKAISLYNKGFSIKQISIALDCSYSCAWIYVKR